MNLVTRNRQLGSQSLAITPNLLQSLQILQFSCEELESYLKDQAEKNPLIEIGAEGRTKAEKPISPGKDQAFAGGSGSRQGSAMSAGEASNLEAYCASSISLRDHLRGQLAMSVPDKTDFVIGVEIIESVDSDGYFRRNPFNLAEMLGVEEGRVLSVLRTLQGFDPAGVCARTLQECLRVQLIEKDRLDPAMAIFIENLPLLATYKITELSRLCGVDSSDILDMAEEIRKLDPRPGRRFDSDPTPPALPDVLVGVRQDGGFTVELNGKLLPRVLVNRDYYAEISASCAGKPEKKFVVDCWKSANWLARNLDQRAQTILKVATEIVARQSEFFTCGAEKLKPLSRKEIAKAIGMHDSTISRAAANKYMSTNRGTFELKFFFSNAIAAADEGDDFSPETVRHKIRSLIEAETSATILSDDAIVAALRDEGVEIARRTVAKYRDAMNLGSSMQRRRQKRALEGLLEPA